MREIGALTPTLGLGMPMLGGVLGAGNPGGGVANGNAFGPSSLMDPQSMDKAQLATQLAAVQRFLTMLHGIMANGGQGAGAGMGTPQAGGAPQIGGAGGGGGLPQMAQGLAGLPQALGGFAQPGGGLGGNTGGLPAVFGRAGLPQTLGGGAQPQLFNGGALPQNGAGTFGGAPAGNFGGTPTGNFNGNAAGPVAGANPGNTAGFTPAAPTGAMPGAVAGKGQSTQFDNIIAQSAQKYGVDPSLVKAVVKQESQFNPGAHSGVGAQGLMQLMPGTAKDLGVKNAWDPKQNIDGGTKYLGQLMKKYDGDMTKAVAAYNAGPGNVNKYGGVPPFKETQDYVKKVAANYNQYKQQAVAQAAQEAKQTQQAQSAQDPAKATDPTTGQPTKEAGTTDPTQAGTPTADAGTTAPVATDDGTTKQVADAGDTGASDTGASDTGGLGGGGGMQVADAGGGGGADLGGGGGDMSGGGGGDQTSMPA